MKIAFAGDSFCMSDDDAGNDNMELWQSRKSGGHHRPSWPVLVANKLNADIIQLGHGGQHLFNAVQELIPNILLADIIVMCVSEPYRIFNNHNLPMNSTWVEQMTTQDGSHWLNRQMQSDENNMPVSKLIKCANAAKEYYDHIFDNDIAEMSQMACISFIEQLLQAHNKKVIWFPCFYDSFQIPVRYGQDDMYWKAMNKKITRQPIGFSHTNEGMKHKLEKNNIFYLPSSGPSINIPLNEISVLELRQQNIDEDVIHHKVNNDDRCNHLNDENNINMAELVLDIIEKSRRSRYVSFLPEVIKVEEYFTGINFNGVATVRS